MKRVLACLLPLALAGCATPVPVVKEALRCEVPAGMLAACGEPAVIKPGITFGELIETAGRDRDALQACSLRQKSLADALAMCNGNIERFNAEVRDINKARP